MSPAARRAPSIINAGGSVVLAAEEALGIHLITGTLGVSGTASVGAAAGVPIISKTTRSYIGSYATINALGQGSTVTADTGHFNISYSPYTLSPGTANPGAIEGSSGSGGSNYNNTSLTGPNNQTTINNPRFTGQRTATRDAKPMRGVAVTADNQDEISIFGVDGGVAGSSAVNITGAVDTLTNNTSATVATGTQINANTPGANADQSVVVAASNDTSYMGIAGGFSLSGSVSVTPCVDVLVVKNTTKAYIDDGATVAAARDVAVEAHESEDFFSIAATVSGGGEVGAAASVSVFALDAATTAYIGNQASSLAAGTKVNAGGSVLVAATDDSNAFTLAGSIGVGIGTGGAGAGVGVTILTKDTEAFIGNFATVNAGGNLGTLPSITESDNQGLTVQAATSESIFNLAASAAGGFYLGLAGGVSIELVTSTTLAYVGNAAQVNTNNAGASNVQSVVVAATNSMSDFSLASGIVIGIAGIAGGVDVGIVRNNTSASLKPASTVDAKGNVTVKAASSETVNTYALSASSAGVGVNASVGFWSIGAPYGSTYSQVDGISPSNLMSEATNADSSGAGASGLISGFSGSTGNPAGNNPNFPTSSTANAQNTVPTSTTNNLVSTSVLATPTIPVGTSALVGISATINAGGNVSVTASDGVTLKPFVGALAIGLAQGFGISASIAIVNENLVATIGAGASVTAGGDVVVTAQTTEKFNSLVVAGGLGSGTGVAGSALIDVLTLNTQAYIDHVTVHGPCRA